MKFTETFLKGSYIIELESQKDSRGWFGRYFCKDDFKEIDHHGEWVQLNHSFTRRIGSVRGMHYQVLPFAEVKMVKCIFGSVFDVIVDVRKESTTFLQWFGIELSAENKKMMYIPHGFAHGFQTLADNSELIYHHTEFYTPGVEAGLRYDDPSLDIKWKLPVNDISERDLSHKVISEEFTGLI